eukprot:g5860.t1
MQLEGAGTPKLRASVAGSRSNMVTVMPAADPCETTFVTVKMNNNFTMDSPDHHDDDVDEPRPARTMKWNSQESFAEEVAQPPRFFHDDKSSSTRAADKVSNGWSESISHPRRSDSNSSGGIDNGNGGDGGIEERRAEQGRESVPSSSSRTNSTEIIPADSCPLQVPYRDAMVGSHGSLPVEPSETMPKNTPAINPVVGSADIGASQWTIGQKQKTILIAFGMLVLGVCIGAHHRYPANFVRAPTTALLPYGRPVGRHTARSTMLGGKVDLQVLAVEHMRVAQDVMLDMHQVWSVLAAAAAREGIFNGRDGSGHLWPRGSGQNESLFPPGDLCIQTLDGSSFKYRSFSEELMSGPWV